MKSKTSKFFAAGIIVAIVLSFAHVRYDGTLAMLRSDQQKGSPQQKQSPHEEEDCPFLRGRSGQWVLDWDYANRTNYPVSKSYGMFHVAAQNFQPSLSQPFRLATAWRWQDENCPVSEISLSGFCRVCDELGITRVLIVGDSLSMLFRLSLLSLVKHVPTRNMFQSVTRPHTVKCSQQFSITVLWYRRSPVEDLLSLSKPNRTRTQHDLFVEENPNRTAVVLNTGAWIKTMPEFQEGLDSMLSWVDSFDKSKIVAFYRETIPGHWPCEPNGSKEAADTFDWSIPVMNVTPFRNYQEYQQNQTTEILAHRYQWSQFESYNAYAKQRIMDKRSENAVPIHWLNVYNSSVLRWDGHIGFGDDCLHYYAPGPTDWWVHFFFSAMIDLATLQNSSDSIS